jgi:photosystem II stability/assembly factor-like uncharacterized protein
LVQKTDMLKKCFLFLLSAFAVLHAEAQKIVLLEQGKQASIRGLCVVNDNIAWISGSNGYTALTTDGGKTWAWQQVKGFEKADFRDIEAFSDKEAVIMASGTPALILKTTDGGKNWQVKYRNTDTTYFLDAMKFADAKHGIVLCDPIKNKFVLLETNDAGETWNMFKHRPNALNGEAAFAASGTCLRYDNKQIKIVTGGTISRKLAYGNNHWSVKKTLLIQGKQSQGAFSISNDGLVIVGGDYQNDHSVDSVAEYHSYKTGKTTLAKTPPAGYQSCVERINKNAYLSTGTPGSNISIDGGKTWAKIDGASYNVCRKAKQGSLVILAGNNGRIAMFKP